jgi:hypothetical protein
MTSLRDKTDHKEIQRYEDKTVKLTYVIYDLRDPSRDPVIKTVVGRVEVAWDDHLSLADPTSDVGGNLAVYYDRIVEIEVVLAAEEAAELIAKSWNLLSQIPIPSASAVDHIINLTHLLEVLTAGPVLDQ